MLRCQNCGVLLLNDETGLCLNCASQVENDTDNNILDDIDWTDGKYEP